MSRGQGRCTSFSLLDFFVLESQQLVTLKGRKQPLQFPVSIFFIIFFYFFLGGGGIYIFVRVCICSGKGLGKGMFQIDLIHSLGKGCFSCVGISKMISL